MRAARSSEMLLLYHITTEGYNPEDLSHNVPCPKKLWISRLVQASKITLYQHSELNINKPMFKRKLKKLLYDLDFHKFIFSHQRGHTDRR
jgi:hypothetical protein